MNLSFEMPSQDNASGLTKGIRLLQTGHDLEVWLLQKKRGMAHQSILLDMYVGHVCWTCMLDMYVGH